jgi:hypothetical protein
MLYKVTKTYFTTAYVCIDIGEMIVEVSEQIDNTQSRTCLVFLLIKVTFTGFESRASLRFK